MSFGMVAASYLSVVNNGLLGAWGFNEGSGVITADLSGHGNHLDVPAAAVWTTGHSGSGVMRGGDNVAADTTGLAWSNMGAITFMGWVYKENNWMVLRGAGSGTGGVARFLIDGDTIGVMTTGGGDAVTVGVPLGEWHHVACTWSSGQPIRAYLDGVLTATGSVSLSGVLSDSSGAYTTLTSLTVGGVPGDGGNTGQLDDLRIFDRALSQGEVATYMNTPVS